MKRGAKIEVSINFIMKRKAKIEVSIINYVNAYYMCARNIVHLNWCIDCVQLLIRHAPVFS